MVRVCARWAGWEESETVFMSATDEGLRCVVFGSVAQCGHTCDAEPREPGAQL